MTLEQHFDCIVIGSGPAGSRAAFDAAAAGMKTAIVELGFVGGTCLNAGCVPTKFLLGGTYTLPLLAAQKKYKVVSGDVHIDLAALQARKERFIKGTRNSVQKQFQEAGITLLAGKASFTGPQGIKVKNAEGEAEYAFSKCIVATGSVPASFPTLKPDGQTVLAAASMLNLKEAPESLIIVGAGAIGIEMGELFHRLGTKIILVEGLPRILPAEDPEVSELLHAYFSKEGWSIHTGKRIASVNTVDGLSKLIFESGEELSADKTLVAVGRRANSAGLELEAAGISVKPNGFVETDECLRCTEHIYAVGDINGRVLLAHAGDHQARHAARHAAGKTDAAYMPPPVPACIYGTMEVMRVGPTQTELAGKGVHGAVSRAPLAENVIPQSYGHPQGFVKMIWTDNVLSSVCVVGHGASHLVSAAALLLNAKIEKNMQIPIIFSHPTLDEALESAMVGPLESF